MTVHSKKVPLRSITMNNKFIHLLYVPTMACNMQCRYCYLEDQTVDDQKGSDCLETLQWKSSAGQV